MEDFTEKAEDVAEGTTGVTVAVPDETKKPADDEVILSDGRVVKLRETTGADSAAVAQILGNKVSLEGAGAVILVQANALKAIVSINGVAPQIVSSYKDYLKLASQFKTRDLNKILQKYMELNSEADPADPLA